jgi:hypothetical protein
MKSIDCTTYYAFTPVHRRRRGACRGFRRATEAGLADDITPPDVPENIQVWEQALLWAMPPAPELHLPARGDGVIFSSSHHRLPCSTKKTSR